MSKYDSLWQYIRDCKKDNLTLTFDEISQICGIEIDHSFLTYKKELNFYGYNVEKISLKNKTIIFSANKVEK